MLQEVGDESDIKDDVFFETAQADMDAIIAICPDERWPIGPNFNAQIKSDYLPFGAIPQARS